MIPPNDAESALYADLTRLVQRMRGATYAAVEAAVEERFQAFLRAHYAGASASLEITQTMTVHDDAEPWSVYRTEYRVRPAEAPVPTAATDEVTVTDYSNVVPFPGAFGHRAAGIAVLDTPRTLRTT